MIREYYEQLHASKSDDLDKMHRFLERHRLPKLTEEEIENLSRPTTRN